MANDLKVVPGEVVDFLIETLPNFAASPEWRNLFNFLSNLKTSQRQRLLDLIESDSTLDGAETFKRFLQLSISEPENPSMMVRLIDLEQKVMKGSGQLA